MIPKWVGNLLNDDGVALIEETIKEVERKTSGEIVPVIVRRSSAIGHIPLILFLIFMLAIYVFNLFLVQSGWLGGRWLWLVIDIFISILLSSFLARFHFIQRYLTSNHDEVSQVMMRAQIEFYESSINQTVDSTGVLIFISIMERRAVVLADRSINSKLPPGTWQNVVDKIIVGIKNKRMAEGLSEAIKFSGELLEKHFPINQNDKNELPNKLIIKI